MFQMYVSNTYELRDNNKTRICSYCGKHVAVVTKVDADIPVYYIEYSCTCSAWCQAINREKEISRYKHEAYYDSLLSAYDPDIHKMTIEEYKCECLLRAYIESEYVSKSNEINKPKKKAHAIRVEHIESGESFPSIYACAKHYGITASVIKRNKDKTFRFLK